MDMFPRALQIVIGSEGGFDDNPSDPGNWTSGQVGHGICRGTKFGVSAAAFPDLDIPHLSECDVAVLYRQVYWERVRGDELPPPLAVLVFDAAVNNGVSRASKWLQTAVGVVVDGVIGPATLTALKQRIDTDGGAAVCIEFQAQRLTFMAALPTWRMFALGWARRLCALPYQALTLPVQ